MAVKPFDGARGPSQEDIAVGDDGDMPGLAGPLAIDDIDAVVHSPRYPVEEKRSLLGKMQMDLQGRASMDATGEIGSLLAYIEDALNRLDSTEAADGNPSSYGFDPLTRAS